MQEESIETRFDDDTDEAVASAGAAGEASQECWVSSTTFTSSSHMYEDVVHQPLMQSQPQEGRQLSAPEGEPHIHGDHHRLDLSPTPSSEIVDEGGPSHPELHLSSIETSSTDSAVAGVTELEFPCHHCKKSRVKCDRLVPCGRSVSLPMHA